jgi:2-haloacid dehalogenase
MENIQTLPARPRLILFDVYETLLNMSDVEKRVNNLLGSRHGYMLWFELLMEYCFVDNCTSQFHDFNSIAKATLKMAAHQLKEKIAEHEIDNTLELFKHLIVHEDVQPVLSALHDLDLRIAALTNTPEETVCERMESSGLISYFERVLSAERIRKYKPDKQVYQWAADTLQVSPSEILLVTSHGWDIAGGHNAGMFTAYRMQDRQILYPLTNEPDLQIKNLDQLVNILSAIK